MNEHVSEKQIWEETTSLVDHLLEDHRFSFGRHWSYNYFNDPKRLAFVLSRYKFAAKMLLSDIEVLELGCSEGIGAMILGEKAKKYVGVDIDDSAIITAKKNLVSHKFHFIHDDFMDKTYGNFGGIVSLDVVEHITQDLEDVFFKTIHKNLSDNGIAIIGTPNITSQSYASEASKIGHVNLFSQRRLKYCLEKFFHQVFCFGMNDEVVHTGFAEMSHYLICLCCDKK